MTEVIASLPSYITTELDDHLKPDILKSSLERITEEKEPKVRVIYLTTPKLKVRGRLIEKEEEISEKKEEFKKEFLSPHVVIIGRKPAQTYGTAVLIGVLERLPSTEIKDRSETGQVDEIFKKIIEQMKIMEKVRARVEELRRGFYKVLEQERLELAEKGMSESKINEKIRSMEKWFNYIMEFEKIALEIAMKAGRENPTKEDRDKAVEIYYKRGYQQL